MCVGGVGLARGHTGSDGPSHLSDFYSDALSAAPSQLKPPVVKQSLELRISN